MYRNFWIIYPLVCVISFFHKNEAFHMHGFFLLKSVMRYTADRLMAWILVIWRCFYGDVSDMQPNNRVLSIWNMIYTNPQNVHLATENTHNLQYLFWKSRLILFTRRTFCFIDKNPIYQFAPCVCFASKGVKSPTKQIRRSNKIKQSTIYERTDDQPKNE